MKSGACRGQSARLWFPIIIDDDGVEWIDDGTIWQAYGDTSNYYDDARTICQSCPVTERCLEYAFEEREFVGMWGGKTPIERRRVERSIRRRLLKERRHAEQSQPDPSDHLDAGDCVDHTSDHE
jgi:hypothetical protein